MAWKIGAALVLVLIACREGPVDRASEGRALLLAGDAARERGDRVRARADYERAWKLAEAADNPRERAQAAYRLFYLAWEETDQRGALQFALASFEAAEEAGDGELQVHAAMALHSALLGVGDVRGAGRALERAMELHGERRDAKLAHMLLNLGSLRLEEGRMALVRDASNRALEIADEGQSDRFYRSIHLNLVEASLAMGDLAAAERNMAAAERYAEPGVSQGVLLYYRSCVEHARGREERALAAIEKALAREHLLPGWTWRFFLQQGTVREALGDRREAELSYAKAAGAVEEMRAALDIDEFKATLVDARRRPLEALFRLQAEDGDFREALATAERATARSFLDAFIRATSARPGVIAPLAPMASVDRAEALTALLPALSRSAAVAPQPVDSVLAALGDRHAVIFFEAEDRFWRIVAGRSRVEIAPLPVPAGEIEDLVDRLLERPDAGPPAEALGQRLLPADSRPARGEPLFLVPDGVLGQVPFAALRIEGRYLMEDHPLVYLPSLSALAATDGRESLARAPASPATPAIVLGDPRGDLPAAAREAREVAARLRTVPFLGEGATRAALERAAGASVLHLATHTRNGPRGPSLMLADGEVGPELLLERRIRSRLVTLATCASAARRGRGLWGSLAAAFLAAGSPAVLASLWSVEDEPARRFVLRFYEEGGVHDPAPALARAQRAAIAAGEPPSAWAPYVLLATVVAAVAEDGPPSLPQDGGVHSKEVP